MKDKKIEFFLPDFYGRFQMIIMMHDLMERSPDFFFEDAKIAAAYGCFPGSIWNGGRIILGSCTKQEIEYAQKELNQRGIAIRFTFTNPLLEEKHLQDTLCNLCLELTNNGMNEIIINSPVLEQYIRNNYPGFALISSTTKCLHDFELIKKELKKDYKYIVLDSSYNNTEKLFTLPNKEKIEIIANHYCQDDCPLREEHYREVGKCQLEFSETDFKPCKNIKRDFYQIMKNESFVTTDLLYGKYKEEGITHFKLDGRAFHKFKVLESLIYYLVRPECRDEVRLSLLRHSERL